MTNSEIAEKARLARSTVAKLSRTSTWDNVTLSTIESFSRACGVDLLRPGEQIDFFRHRRLAYMENATPGQKRMLDRLIAELESRAAVTVEA